MRLTRVGWEALAIFFFLAGLAVSLSEAMLAITAATIGGLIIAGQVEFLRSVTELENSLIIDQEVSRDEATAGESVSLTLSARRSWTHNRFQVEVVSNPPPTVRIRDTGTITVDLTDDAEASTTCHVELPVAGTVVLPPPTVTIVDSAGCFETCFSAGNELSVDVESRQVGPIHVGAGGHGVVSAYGEHEGGPFGSGLTPEELREYSPGDPVARIDWKTLARLGEPYVRIFAAESDRETAIVFDHRARMRAGPDGATKLDYAREIALGYLSRARELGDPVGLYTVGDDGVTRFQRPAANRRNYDWIRATILGLSPTETRERQQPEGFSPAAARRVSARLRGNCSFGNALTPFFEQTTLYARRIRTRVLYGAVNLAVGGLREDGQIVLITDDSDRVEVLEAAKLARSAGGQTLVLLLPDALFAPAQVTDLEPIYREYVDFEEYRRKLDRLEGVRALEVGPQDRLQALLSDRDRRRIPP